MKLILYILLVVAMVPVFLIGFLFHQLPILLQRGKVSGTAYAPFNGRLLYHSTGSRPDAFAMQLSRGLPATNYVFVSLAIKPLVWASRVTGHIPAILEYPPPRPTPLSAIE